MSVENILSSATSFFDEVRSNFVGGNIWGAGQSNVSVSEENLQVAVLTSLADSSKAGLEIIEHIRRSSGGLFTPSEGRVFSLLAKLTDEKLAKVEMVNEIKNYSISKAGKTWLVDNARKPKETGEDAHMGSKFGSSASFKAKSDLAKASGLLVQAVAAVASLESIGKKEQAAKILDEASKKLFGMAADHE